MCERRHDTLTKNPSQIHGVRLFFNRTGMELKGMLCIKIELKRRQMFNLAKKYGFTSDQTVQCSQELDQLLNQLQIEQHQVKSQQYVN